MGTTLRAAAAAAVLLLVAGCSDDGPSPRDPTSTWSPTGKMETPTSAAPDPVEPELPAAAAEASEAGARAFIEYYWELINYAQATGDVKALRAASGANCAGCNAGIRGIRQRHRAGQHVVGGAYRVRVTDLSKLSISSGELTGFHATVVAEHDAQTATSTDGTKDVRAAGESTADMYLIWINDSGWRVDLMDVQ